MRAPEIVTSRAIERPVTTTVAVGLFAGLAATLITNLAQGPLRAITPDRVDQHEKRIRPGTSSSLVAAQKISKLFSINLNATQQKFLGQAIHLTTGMAWGPVYGLLRRSGVFQPATAALVSGAGMSLILDEVLVPALGFSAPAEDYLTFTRVRGVVAHLIYGAVAAVAAEGIGWALTASAPRCEALSSTK